MTIDPISPSLIHHLLEQSALRYPAKIALIHGRARLSYSEINDRANSLGRYLIHHGLSFGDRVALLLENSVEYVIAYYAVLKSGGVVVPLNTALKGESLNGILRDCDPIFLITEHRFERMLQPIDFPGATLALVVKNPKSTLISTLPVYSWQEAAGGICSGDLQTGIAEETLASIIYTSGSTGRPKGVMLSHRNIIVNTKAICSALRLRSDDVQMVVLPFFYVMGKSLLNTHFAVGGTVVINNHFAYPAELIKQMITEKVTAFSGVPSTYAYLLHKSPLVTSRDQLVALRYCAQAGGHMAASLKIRLLEALPIWTRLYIMYGATEASARLTYVEPEVLRAKIGSIGRAIDGVELSVLDEQKRALGEEQTGELVAKGENIMLGYWQDSEASSRVLSEHGYHTGDLGYRDRDGYYYVIGRKDDQLKVGGHRVNLREIEDHFMAADSLVETVVFAIPDELLGNRLVALVVAANARLDSSEIYKVCCSGLPSYKVPAEILLVSNLPKNASGKVDVEQCKAMYLAQKKKDAIAT